jgi:hypothetical protein
MANRIPIKWNLANFKWNDSSNLGSQRTTIPLTWSDCALLQEVAAAAQGGHLHEVWKDKKKKKRFVELIATVQGKEYKETKSIEEVEILIKDVELVLKEAMGIDLKIKV